MDITTVTLCQFLLYLFSLCAAQTIKPAWLDQTQRPPPPAQAQEVIDKLINNILSGKSDSNPFSSLTTPGVAARDDLGPLALANSSHYWTWTNLKGKHSVKDENEAKSFHDEYESEAEKVYAASVEAGWNYFTNLTEYNRKQLVRSDVLLTQFLKLTSIKARQFEAKQFVNDSLRRILDKLSSEGLNALSEDKYKHLINIQTEMSRIYANGAVCEEGRPPPCTMQLEPDLSNIMATSTDYSRLYYVWLAWRNSVGPQMRHKYLELIQLSNEAAVLNGFSDIGAMWRSPYEIQDLEHVIDELYAQIKPFYVELHAYVRRGLMKLYPDYVQKDGPIPAHLLGNMWATSWVNLYESTAPYPSTFNVDPTPVLFSQNYTTEKMFKQAERFYTSIGFDKLPDQFWRRSMFTRPQDRDVLCVPAAVDFRNGNDFRVKMCAQVSADDFIRAHNELGHIYYFDSYKHQPVPFRDGANPAFLDAVGGLSAMSARTVKYLSNIGLGPLEESSEADINYLYRVALDRLAFVSFAYVAEKWRWDLASGEANSTNMEHAWWNLRLQHQGIASAAERTERDFEPGSNIQLAQNLPLIQHFIGFVLQFQLYKSLCQKAGHTGPLVKCSFHNSKEAGKKLKELMELGSSKPWPEALEKATGTRVLSAAPMLEYFQPLIEYLRKKNAEHKEFSGWNSPKSIIKVLRPGNTGANGTHSKAGVFDNQQENVQPLFPGSTCTQGQKCLEGSFCNGTHCDCPTGMVLWYQICLPNDPTAVGFGAPGSFDLTLSKGNKTFKTVVAEKDNYNSDASKQCHNWNVLSILLLLIVVPIFYC